MKNTNEMNEFVNRNSLVEGQSKSSRRTTLNSRLSTLVLIVFCLLFGGKAWGQTTLTVCDGSVSGTTTATCNYVPIYGLYVDTNNQNSEFVIPAETYGMSNMIGGTISKLAFYITNNPATWGNPTVEVYMGEVDGTTISSLNGPANFTSVWTGTLSNQNATMEITLSTPYTYNGGNLLIGMYVISKSSTYKTTTFTGISAVSGSSLYNSGSGTGTAQPFLPKTTFTYTPCTTSRSLSFSNCPTSVGIGSAINCTPLPSVGSGYGTITYTSSNTDIAIVDANTGLVTGVSAGNATITAKISYASGYCPATATHSVYVIPTPQIEISAISGNNFSLTASITESFPSGYKYHWYSDEACTQEISGASGTNNANLTYTPTCDQRVYCRLQKNTPETQVANFGFSGEVVQTYTVPVGTTSLNMEVWGAQGGGSHDAGVFYPNNGGKGGYSKGSYSTQAGQTLYVCVGGRGSDGVTITEYPASRLSAPGGYNGGGAGARDDETSGAETGGGGGGATHIATSTGVLSSLFPSNSDNILIVAGGGGGSSCQAPGGCGGGTTGGDAKWGGGNAPITWQQNSEGGGRGGSESTNGILKRRHKISSNPDRFGDPYIDDSNTFGGFGQGAGDNGNREYPNGVGGGGGGYYGGCVYASDENGRRNSGGGGSGYLKNTLSSSQTIAGSSSFTAPESGNETGHPGNGYARITASSVIVVGAAHSIIMKTSPSVITSIVTPEAVCYGGSISITPPEYTENGSAVTATGWEVASTESGTYSGISQISSSDEGKYVRFVATNECGSARSNAVQIANMKPSPSVSSITDAVTAYCGDYITLEATPSSGNISWYRDANCTNELSSANVLSLGKLMDNATYYATANENFDLESVEEYGSEVFEYTGSVQSYIIPEGTAAVKLEVWGAQGGSYSDTYAGGKGGYAVGTLDSPTVGSTLYIEVGGQGTSVPVSSSSTTGGAGGYNGGGNGGNGSSTTLGVAGSGGGGATHIATVSGLLKDVSSSSVLLVAGGGGGASGASMCGSGSLNAGSTSWAGGAAGVNGGKNTCSYNGNGGAAGTISGGGNGGSICTTTCTSSDNTYYPSGGGGAGAGYYGGGGGAGGGVHTNGSYYAGTAGGNGSFGKGGNGGNSSSSYYGYYGGGGGSGAGGSSYVSSSLQDATTYNGNATFASTSGSTETGHSGNGYARITLYRHKTITCASSVRPVPITISQLQVEIEDVSICEGTATELAVDSPLGSDVTYSWNSGSATALSSYNTGTLDNTTGYTVVATKNIPDNANSILRSYSFDYTGDVQEVVVPSGAEYAILEVWGAQGGYSLANGVSSGQGGKGGYSYGYYVPSVGQTLYVVVGGKGTDGIEGQDSPGGYNGGGLGTWDNNDNETSGGGGGATHIATSTGVLSSLSGNSSAVLIVAGGGGGASWDTNGGYGGGATAGSGAGSGTSISGAFGYGADATGHTGNGDGVGGGGGGYQGGRAYDCKSGSSNAEGGTGYINTVLLTDASLIAGNASMPNPAGGNNITGKEGNGYARIIFYGNGGSAGSCVSAVKNVTVTVDKKPTAPISVSVDNVICNGTEYTLTANEATLGSGAEYRWGIGSEVGINPIDGTTASITITPNDNTTYWVRMKGTTACKDFTDGITKSVTVNTPVPSITGATTICSSGAILTATGGSQYKWNGDSDFSNVASKSITEAGTYTVTIKDANGCTASTSREINVKTTPTVSINSYTTPVDCGTEVTLSATSGQTVNWYSNSDCTASASPTFTPTSDAVTRYAKVATDYAGIIDTIDYDTPGIYEFVVPGNVNSVKMEVWGAQGGYGRGNENSNDPARGYGGNGGYATGKLTVTEGQHLYVVVGGKGEDATFGNIATPAFTAKGGYNGGGNGSCDKDPANDEGREASGAGGGATHIATASGLLSSLSGNTGAVLLVAGGGGGGSWRFTGGYGGGAEGGNGGSKADYQDGLGGGKGGGQSPRSDASPQINGTFGQGAQFAADGNGDGIAGGGGGYYGGNANTYNHNDPNSGGGGSGYYKSTLTEASLIAGNASMPNPAGGNNITGKEGNGYARIIVYRSSPLTCASTASATVAVTPANVTLTQISDQTMCAGTSITLSAQPGASSTNTTTPDYEYSWDIAAGLSISSGNVNISRSGSYTYNVTATLNDNATCTATDSKTVEVAYKTPSASEISAMGLENGNLLWTGKNPNWNTDGNWMQYSGGTYTLASTPTSLSNVVIGSYSDCVSTPTLNVNADASVNSLKIASGITVSGDNTLSMDGNLVNNGTFNAPVRFNGTTTLSGSGTTTFRDITIAGSFNASSASLTVSGNWTNNGTFTANGPVVFDGASAQNIGGNNATTFNNVTFNNANGISISKEPTITGTATFSRGVVTGDVTFGTSATAGTASLTSHIDGKVTKNGNANGFTFPTGDNGNLGTVAVTTDASNVSVQYFGNSAGFGVSELPRWWNVADMCGDNPFNHISNMEYWKISSSTIMTATFNAQAASDMHFNSNTGNRNPANINMAFYGSNCWKNVGGTASVDGNTIKIEGAVIPASTRDISGNYSTFGSTNENTLLPIELVSFTATCDGRSSLIEWTTATEKNNDYFSLERSDDAVNFTEIARVAGAGSSIEPIDYAYTDYGIHGGDNYYRLVQVDYDGTRTASEIIVANCIESEVDEPEVQAYPNPFSGELTLVLDNFNNRAATIEVYDMLGKLIYIQKADAPQNYYEMILNLSNLPSGAYTVRVSTTDFVINKNVVKN